MIKRYLIISVTSAILSVSLMYLTLHKISCRGLEGCLDCYCGWTVGGWPLPFLSLEGGGLKMYELNYLNLFLDFSIFFIVLFIILFLLFKKLKLTTKKHHA